MSDGMSADTAQTPGPKKLGGKLHVQRVTGPCIIVQAQPDELFVAALGDGAGYAMDVETGLLRVWDRQNTYQVNPQKLVLLRVANVIKLKPRA